LFTAAPTCLLACRTEISRSKKRPQSDRRCAEVAPARPGSRAVLQVPRQATASSASLCCVLLVSRSFRPVRFAPAGLIHRRRFCLSGLSCVALAGLCANRIA
jgi:hypothetical protein